MPRIRSIHPALFTDESFVSVSDAAQIFYVGLLTEADDQGVFEWKPLTLKMRLRPASTQPVDGLLAELESVDRIMVYEICGRKYGAIRNFRKFQRPKYPNATHPITDDVRTYVGLSMAIPGIEGDDDGSLPPIAEDRADDTASVPRNGGKSIQMEDGGGRREEIRSQGQRPESPEPRKESSKTARAPVQGFGFEGKVIRLSRKDLATWRKTYHAIPDLMAELSTLDAYYGRELSDEEQKRWFIRCSAALDKKHQAFTANASRSNGGIPPNEGVFGP